MKRVFFLLMSFLVLATSSLHKANACTRFTYVGLDNIVISARSMDWRGEMLAKIYVNPRNITRYDGLYGEKGLSWKVKYGSVGTVYMEGLSDGVNEKGLQVSMLWLNGSQYADPATSSKPLLSSGTMSQYILDNYASVDEVVEELSKAKFDVVRLFFEEANLGIDVHYSITDEKGDNAIVELVDGEMVIYHDENYRVMTNEPVYSEQLARAQYWNGLDGMQVLPGTNHPTDRFVRAEFFLKKTPKISDVKDATATVFSIIRNLSFPIMESEDNRVSPTIWRTVFDHKNKIYYFEDCKNLNNMIWLDLSKIDFSLLKEAKSIDPNGHNGELSIDDFQSQVLVFSK